MSAELKPGYKQTEVGVIPEDWESVRAGDIGRFRGGNGFPTRFQGKTLSDYPFYKVSDMNNEGNETFMFDSNNWISEGIRKQLGATAFPTDSIIFAKVGAAVFLERKKILAKPSCIDNNLAGLVLNRNRTNVRFIHYALLNIKFGAFVSTTALPSLNGNVLSQIAFALPPLPEQTAIAEALSDADALIESLEQLIAKKRHLKQGAMQELLTGKKRLPGFEIKPGYKQTEVGVIPKDWEVSTFSELFDVTAGGDVDPKRSASDQDETHCYPIYSNALTNRGLYGYCSYADHQARSISITARGTLGSANFRDHPYTAIGRVLVLQAKTEIAESFFAEVINHRVKFAIESTGVPQLTAPQISTYRLPVPPLPEQTAIATILSDMDIEIAALEAKLAKARQIKQGMMQELLTGRIRLV